MTEKNQEKKTQDHPVQAETQTTDLPNMPEALPLGGPVEQWSGSYKLSSSEPKLKVMIRSDFT